MNAPISHHLLQPVRRWTALRKAAIVDAIESGALRRDQVEGVHGISSEELESWIFKRFEERPDALKQTRLQDYPAVRA